MNEILGLSLSTQGLVVDDLQHIRKENNNT